jgi:hypothetical protein
MGRRAWAINSRLSFSDLVYDRKRQDASILVTTSIAMIIAEIVSCQAEVRDGEKNGRAHFQALKHWNCWHVIGPSQTAGLAQLAQFPQTSFELQQSRDSPANSDHSTTPGAERSDNQST